jgi:cystathionine gamma-synthase
VAPVYRDRASALSRLRPATRAVLGGRPSRPGVALNQPPVFASAFAGDAGVGYARQSNPTWEAFESALGGLEGGTAVAFGSGMAAAGAILETLATRARVLVAETAYLEVRERLDSLSRRGHLRVEVVDALDTGALLQALPRADLLWLDAIANPGLELPELDLVLPAALSVGARTVVDATLATPILLRALELRADVVIHSATKYIGGHSDLMLGAAVARDARFAAELRRVRAAAGSVPGTMEAWLALRGIRTLPLRVDRACASAAVLAERLAADARVDRVHYPGLRTHRTSAVAGRLLAAPGGIVSFELSDAARADAVCAALEVITHAASLGGVETVIERQARWHTDGSVPEGLLRLSVGCEDPEDLWEDLDRALGA